MATHTIGNNRELQEEWTRSVGTVAVDPSADELTTTTIGRVVLLKMLHSQCKEFMVTSRMIETLEGGKSVDVDVALRLKLKTYASEKSSRCVYFVDVFYCP